MAYPHPAHLSESSDSDDSEYSDDQTASDSDGIRQHFDLLLDDVFSLFIKTGRGMRGIRRIVKRSHVTICSGTHDPLRVMLHVSGTPPSIKKALSMLADMISKCASTDRTIKLVLTECQYKYLIGDGASEIVSIDSSTGARFHIFGSSLINPIERYIVISGRAERIMNCIMKVLDIFQQLSSRNITNLHGAPFSGQSTSTSATPSHWQDIAGPSSTETSQAGATSTSTSATLSNSQNIAGPSSAATPQVGAASTSTSATLRICPNIAGPSSAATPQVLAASTSTSETLSNSQNIAGPSSAATPRVGATSKSTSVTLSNYQNVAGPSSVVAPQAGATSTSTSATLSNSQSTAGPSSAATPQVEAASTSTSETLSNSQNIAGPSSVAAPQAGVTSPSALAALNLHRNTTERLSAASPPAEAFYLTDIRTFGDFVVSKMQKMNAVHQSSLRSEIFTLLNKFEKAEVNSSSTETMDRCVICLDEVRNKTFVGECLHSYCHTCIQEWMKIKSTCPICIRKINNIFVNINHDLWQQLHVSVHATTPQ